jgi:outer membrane protein assembly factor BamB
MLRRGLIGAGVIVAILGLVFWTLLRDRNGPNPQQLAQTDTPVESGGMVPNGDSQSGSHQSGSGQTGSQEGQATQANANSSTTSNGSSPSIGSVPGEEITDQVREMNSDKFAAPPRQFRPGNAQPSQRRVQIHRDKNGFTIQLPSGAPIATPTVYQGKVYVSGGFRSREYYCFDAKTGELLWSVDLSDDGPSSAVCADGIVVFNTESCTLFALDAQTGKHLWSHWLGDPLTSTPAIANGIVFTSYPAAGRFAGAEQSGISEPFQNLGPAIGKPPQNNATTNKRPPEASHVLAAFELKTGRILWQRWIDSDVISAPVAVGNEVYATSFAGTVYRFRQKDGSVLAAHRCRATSAPTLANNQLYWSQRADQKGQVAEAVAVVDKSNNSVQAFGNLRAAPYLDAKVQGLSVLQSQFLSLDAANGFAGGAPAAANAAAAQQNIGQSTVSGMQFFQGSRVLYFRNQLYSSMGDELVCLEAQNGQERWRHKVKGDLHKEGGHLAAPPALAGGKIVLATVAGEVLLLDPDKGTVYQSYKVGAPIRSQPAIVDGRIYVGTQNGRLVCIDTGDPSLTGWYTWGGDMAHTNARTE